MFEDTRLKVFMTVARTGSFTAAAREIGISQPAVSQNIAELERGVGEPLFDRQKGAVRLTDKGIAFKEFAGRILHWYGAMDSMFGPSSRITYPAKVRIAADSYCADFLVPRLIAALRTSSDNLRFIIKPYDNNIKEGDFDISFYTQDRPDEDDLLNTATRIGSVEACAVSSATASASGTGLPEGMRIAMWEPYCKLVPEDIKALTVIESRSVSALEAAALSSRKIAAIIPSHDSISPSLTPLPLPLSYLRRDIHMRFSPEFASSGLSSRVSSLVGIGII